MLRLEVTYELSEGTQTSIITRDADHSVYTVDGEQVEFWTFWFVPDVPDDDPEWDNWEGVAWDEPLREGFQPLRVVDLDNDCYTVVSIKQL